jgi:hypothetical protein
MAYREGSQEADRAREGRGGGTGKSWHPASEGTEEVGEQSRISVVGN